MLVHNIKSDAIWGFEYGVNSDDMGRILMRVCDHLLNKTKVGAGLVEHA